MQTETSMLCLAGSRCGSRCPVHQSENTHRQEGSANGRLFVLLEIVRDEAEHDRGLSNSRLAEKDEFRLKGPLGGCAGSSGSGGSGGHEKD